MARRNSNFALKYSAKKDGCNTEFFHEKCDNINNFLIICKPKNLDIIGGYISTPIVKEDKYCEDDKAFLFNLTKNFVRKNKKSHLKAVKNFKNSDYFIKFGDRDVFILSGNCLKDGKSYAV